MDMEAGASADEHTHFLPNADNTISVVMTDNGTQNSEMLARATVTTTTISDPHGGPPHQIPYIHFLWSNGGTPFQQH